MNWTIVRNIYQFTRDFGAGVGAEQLAGMLSGKPPDPMVSTFCVAQWALLAFSVGAHITQERQQSAQLKHIETLLEQAEQQNREQVQRLKQAAEKLVKSNASPFDALTDEEKADSQILLLAFMIDALQLQSKQTAETIGQTRSVIEDHIRRLCEKLGEKLINRFNSFVGLRIGDLERLVKQLDEQHAQRLRALKTELEKELKAYLDALHYPPLHIPQCLNEEERFLARLLPKSRWVALIGRDAEMATLHRFLTPDPQRPFKWTLITGRGGQGKTRLALEIALWAYTQGWNAGFYRRDAHYDDWERWEPQENTLVVMDYVALQAETARRAILAMAEKARRNGVQLRMLLLERYFSDQEQWVKDLLATGSQDTSTIRTTFWTPVAEDTERLLRSATLGIQPSQLQPLSEGDFIAIMRNYHDQYCACQNLPAQTLADSDLQRALQSLPVGDYRPLFAAFAGEAIAEKGIHEVRHWNAQELTQWVLERDFAQWQQRGVDQKHLNLLALATLLGALDIETAQRLARAHPDLLPDIDNEFDEARYNALTAYSPSENRDQLVGLHPDLLGELFILQRLGNQFQTGGGLRRAERDTKKLIQIAWCENPLTMAQFMIRCAGDFPSHPQHETLLLLEPDECTETREVYSTALPQALARFTTPSSQALFDKLIQRCTPAQRAVARLARGLLYHDLESMNAAINDFIAVIAMPDAPARLKIAALVSRGVMCERLGRLEEALADYTAVIAMPDAPAEIKATAFVNRGVVYGRLGCLNEAISDLTMVIAMPDAPVEEKAKAHYNRGVGYRHLGRTDEALVDYTAVIAMPDAPAYEKAQAFVNRGGVYWQLGRTDEALADCTAVVAMPDAPAEMKAAAFVNRGVVYEWLGRLEEARADLAAVVGMPDAPEEVLRLAQELLRDLECE